MRKAFVFSGLLVSGCSSVPMNEIDGIAAIEIVQRIKCEIAYAVKGRSGQYPSGDLQWMKSWTAKVDLQLEATNTAAITPNINIIEPLTTVTLPGIGPFTRNFTMGA